MSFVIEDVLVRAEPLGERLPVVVDSPHSGNVYPPDFGFVCPMPVLRQAEDSYVDELFAAAPEAGAVLLAALFPRTYIDVNRAPDDIDAGLLDGPWPWPLSPSDKTAAGMGLIRRLCRPGQPMYDGRLTVAQVIERIERCYRPYHEELCAAIEGLHRRFGRVYHLNCHSMPSIAVADRSGPVDFVLGDRDGTTSDPAFSNFVCEVLTELGYRVRMNDPYKGVELVRRYSDPRRGISSLQIEINRALYMEEQSLRKTSGFEGLRADVTTLLHRIGDFARLSLAEAAE
ncbi:N-formylglutamate amidohydrolase [Arenibaculum pallidiluteum]|uniref:N-formylglutamate amidohydrolase n=1 Tax=Arenibaculum pallidiluteum TaxID=2812559 RepID=UPI001A97C059|nr:N-formylglutamate amidohydrolase [Arenibaculum pallidiluteum]